MRAHLRARSRRWRARLPARTGRDAQLHRLRNLRPWQPVRGSFHGRPGGEGRRLSRRAAVHADLLLGRRAGPGFRHPPVRPGEGEREPTGRNGFGRELRARRRHDRRDGRSCRGASAHREGVRSLPARLHHRRARQDRHAHWRVRLVARDQPGRKPLGASARYAHRAISRQIAPRPFARFARAHTVGHVLYQQQRAAQREHAQAGSGRQARGPRHAQCQLGVLGFRRRLLRARRGNDHGWHEGQQFTALAESRRHRGHCLQRHYERRCHLWKSRAAQRGRAWRAWAARGCHVRFL